ncbi:MarR family transcriptional regulator [Niabella hibiscisoli]|uniref:MarR family transcriptional regulator n=1 Tax=Niabella hibiscisoli TaxID=1825928 RepID=UPI001F0F9B4F|nr:MarR family transcriptional regulator [Niabella hibiscisoli]MCH5717700.1 MarR family transcriptional regulator [Niabella hibiscisoli]
MNIDLLALNPLIKQKTVNKQELIAIKLLRALHINGPMPVTALTKSLEISIPVLSTIISRLVKEKWVEKKEKENRSEAGGRSLRLPGSVVFYCLHRC